jgi:lysyl-tRNA synthetase class 2
MNGSNWRPAASRQVLETRAALLIRIREFFAQRGVMEVETPVLSRARNSDPNINSMAIEASRQRFLRTSPEYPMKRLMAA